MSYQENSKHVLATKTYADLHRYIHTHTHTHTHTHIYFTDPVFVTRQLNMKKIHINFRQHTHTHTHTHMQETRNNRNNNMHYTEIDYITFAPKHAIGGK